ncbi:MAG TPA: hypothetical protein VGB82_07345 [Alphaproteobacteria bacterium]
MSNPSAADPVAVHALEALEIRRLSVALNELQVALPYTVWPYMAQSLAAATARLVPEFAGPKPDAYDPKLHLLRNQGIADLGTALDSRQVAEVQAYFASRPCFAAHVAAKSDGQERTVEECAALGPQASYRLADIIRAPHLIELANRDDILALAESYLGCVPSIYSMNAFWTFPGAPGLIPGLQTFHRDFDDFRFCTMFIFLTGASPSDGAHYYIRGTHRPDLMQRHMQGMGPPEAVAARMEQLFAKLAIIDDALLDVFSPQITTVGGPPGTVVLEDTYGLHKGDVPKTPRLLAWVRYGLYRNVAHLTDRIEPLPRGALAGRIPDTPRHRYINRLVVEP